jgi:hypothetical protein
MFCHVIWKILTNISEVLTASIIRAIALCTSETVVNIYQTTQCNIPGDSHLQQAAMFICISNHPFPLVCNETVAWIVLTISIYKMSYLVSHYIQ